MSKKPFNYSKQFKNETPEEVVTETTVETQVDVQPEPAATQAPPTMGTVVGCDKLRVRVQPNGEVMRTINKGDEVVILETLDGWYKVGFKGITGYCMAQFIELQ